MKRCWLGAGLLMLLLVTGLISSAFLARFGEDISREAEKAAMLTDTDRGSAEEILREIHRDFLEKRFLLMVLTDHEPLREVETLFALLESPGDTDSFRENALRLAQILEQIGRSQTPRLDNIL